MAFAATLAQQGLDEAGTAEAVRLAEWYEKAMPLHHRDEERALFPRIVNRSFLIDGMIERLALDHDEIEARGASWPPCSATPRRSQTPNACPKPHTPSRSSCASTSCARTRIFSLS